MFSLDKLLIIIVLYKQKLKNSAPFNSISSNLNNNKVQWYVYDNSPIADKEVNTYSNVTYISDPTNPGVSKAYNKGAAYGQLIQREWLLLFDQDTELPDNFLNELNFHLNQYPESKFYAMKLFKGNSLISPSGYKFKRGFILNHINAGINSIREISFLNSGLLIAVDLYHKAGGYDEHVPLYFSDFVFVNRLRNVCENFTLLPIHLRHDLASNDMSDISSFKVRYDMYLKGVKEALNSERNGVVAYYSVSFLRALKLTYLHKDIYYLKSYWKHLMG